MIAPAAWALTSVLSSFSSNTSSGMAPTSTALSLPSNGKLQQKKVMRNTPVQRIERNRQDVSSNG